MDAPLPPPPCSPQAAANAILGALRSHVASLPPPTPPPGGFGHLNFEAIPPREPMLDMATCDDAGPSKRARANWAPADEQELLRRRYFAAVCDDLHSAIGYFWNDSDDEWRFSQIYDCNDEPLTEEVHEAEWNEINGGLETLVLSFGYPEAHGVHPTILLEDELLALVAHLGKAAEKLAAVQNELAQFLRRLPPRAA